MRRVVCCIAASAAVVLCLASPALADDLKVRAHWKSCETLAAGLSFRTEFSPPARYYGEGRYLIKSEIRWDKYTVGGVAETRLEHDPDPVAPDQPPELRVWPLPRRPHDLGQSVPKPLARPRDREAHQEPRRSEGQAGGDCGALL